MGAARLLRPRGLDQLSFSSRVLWTSYVSSPARGSSSANSRTGDWPKGGDVPRTKGLVSSPTDPASSSSPLTQHRQLPLPESAWPVDRRHPLTPQQRHPTCWSPHRDVTGSVSLPLAFSTSTSDSHSPGAPAQEAATGSAERGSNPQHGSPHGPHSASSESHQQSPAEEGPSLEDPAKAVLAASLPFVLECGWTEAAMVEGARAAGMSPAFLSLFPRREAHLVEFFMDECRHKFENLSRERALKLLATEDLGARLELVIRMRLEQQALYTSTWAQALSIQALPGNLGRTAEQRMQLIASLWGAAGERTRTDLEARALCTMLSAVYTASELFMLTDFSPGYEESWQFLHQRMSEGLQAYAGLSAAQDQILKASKELFQRLGMQPPSGVPFAGLNPFTVHSKAATPTGDSHEAEPQQQHPAHHTETGIEHVATDGSTPKEHQPREQEQSKA